jgi:phage repressor protein C with HTH and peptisase S24 domain
MEPGNLIKTERVRRKWSQAELGKRVGISQPAIKKIEAGGTVKSKHLPKIAEELGIPLSKLDASLSQHGDGTVNQPKEVAGSVVNPTLQIVSGEQLMGRVDLPVYSIVQGGRGALVLSSEPFTNIARPHILLGLRDAYAVLVKGNSMAREYSEGDIAYVDPHRHPKEGDPCVFQSHKEDGEVQAIIKYLARSPDASPTLWYVEQTHPPKKFTLKKAEWQICHVAVGKQSGR